MKRQRLLMAVTVALLSAPASSLMAAPSDNVVVLHVAGVTLPARLPGACRVHGAVEQVLDGADFRPGEVITIPVLCARHASAPPPHARPPRARPHVLDAEVLQKHKRAVARIDAEGRPIWRRAAHRYGRYGYVSGYRVLDGVFLPLSPGARG